MTGRFENCSANKPWNKTFDDCTNGSLVEACLVQAACTDGSMCPPEVIDYVSLVEGPYPEGPSSFKGCGGSAATCMHRAGLAAPLITDATACINSRKRSLAALHAAEAQGWRAFQDGHGFPALHVRTTYVADANSVLLRICSALAAEADSGSGSKSLPPAACSLNTFELALSLHWPVARFDGKTLSGAARPALDAAITKGFGGDSVVAALPQAPSVAHPVDAGDGKLNVSVTFATLAGYAPQALAAPQVDAFAQSLATNLNASGWTNFQPTDVLAAKVAPASVVST